MIAFRKKTGHLIMQGYDLSKRFNCQFKQEKDYSFTAHAGKIKVEPCKQIGLFKIETPNEVYFLNYGLLMTHAEFMDNVEF